MKVDVKDMINFSALSVAVTGSKDRIRREPAEKYAQDVQELEDMISLWIKWKREKHG